MHVGALGEEIRQRLSAFNPLLVRDEFAGSSAGLKFVKVNSLVLPQDVAQCLVSSGAASRETPFSQPDTRVHESFGQGIGAPRSLGIRPKGPEYMHTSIQEL